MTGVPLMTEPSYSKRTPLFAAELYQFLAVQGHRTLVGGHDMLAGLDGPFDVRNGRFPVDGAGEGGFDDDVGRAVLDDVFVPGIGAAAGESLEGGSARHREDGGKIDAVALDEGAEGKIGDGHDAKLESERAQIVGVRRGSVRPERG